MGSVAGQQLCAADNLDGTVDGGRYEQCRWKAEQLGGGYALSGWAERTAVESAAAVIAVSEAMKADVLSTYPTVDPDKVHVINNGIDAQQYGPDLDTDVLQRYGVDPRRPNVVFVGRITRQKGVPVLLRAAAQLDPQIQLVLCAGQPDTPELAREVTDLVSDLRRMRSGVIWIEGMLHRQEVIQLLSHATAFVCPSLYEPLGIVNLEAMACGSAVVASRVGGIPEVVADGETGLLVPPDDPRALADALNALARDRSRADAMGSSRLATRDLRVRLGEHRPAHSRPAPQHRATDHRSGRLITVPRSVRPGEAACVLQNVTSTTSTSPEASES